MTSAWLAELNPAQREAVTYGEGPLLVVAGAGTGKTRTLASRVAYLVENGVPPERILLLTFTRRASGEMLSRAGQLTSEKALGRVWGGTFHAVANRLLRIYGRALDLTPDFTVMDQADAADLMNLIRNELGLSKKERRFPRKMTLVKIYSHTVNAEMPLSKVVERYFPWCEGELEPLSEIFNRYTQRKRASHVLDYDDLLLCWRMLCTVPRVGEKLAGSFDHVLVDEYQDTNAIQAHILLGMRKSNPNIMAVGDDAQSIYSFRAATIRNILDFPEQFPGTHVVTLEENYRSTQPILHASNAVMTSAKERYTKDLWSQRESAQKPILVTCADEGQQSELICRHILDQREQGTLLMQQAVLFRASHHSGHLEIELAKRNIPFHKYGGLKFLEAAHIKDMLAFLRILENPFDELSWFRVLQMLESVGPRTASRIMDELGVRRTVNPGERNEQGTPSGGAVPAPLVRLAQEPPAVPAQAADEFNGLCQALTQCAGLRRAAEGAEATTDPLTLPAQLERIQEFYEPIFKRTYENPKVRLRDLEQLQHIASRYRSRSRFITDLTLDPPNSTSDLAGAPHLDEDYLILSTIHSAKGMEWTAVHIMHAADGMIPSDMAVGDDAGVDEERRLFYVAMTRAKNLLYVYFPLRYYHNRFGTSDAHGYAQLTRFMPKSVCKLFEHRSPSDGTESDELDSAHHTPTTVRQMDTNVSRLWNS